MQPLPQPVSERDSGSLIAEIEARATDRRAGIFGPQSISWQVNRESALFLGAGRAALLQLAHPWVATALEQHSSLMSNPFARFHSTFRTVFTMIFGTVEQATAAAHHLYHVHTFIEGNLQEDVASYRSGSHYRANEIAALRWVYATLVESAVLAYETVLPPLSPDQLDAYYAESQTMAALFGIPAHALPSSWTEFLAYCRTMEQSSELGVTSAARAMAQGLLSGAGSWIRPPRWYHALTTQWLAPRLQADFGLSLQPAGRRSLERAQRWLPRIYSRLPGILRFVGPWHEAQSRLSQSQPSPFTRLGNRFWIGQPLLPVLKSPAPK